MKLSRLIYHFRLRSFDERSQEGRIAERHRQILLTTLSSGAAKMIAAVISFAIIPLTLTYLGTERFGLWVTISSIVGMLSFADLGIGSGLMNAVATAQGKDDTQEIRTKIATGFMLLSVIAVFVIVLFFLIEPFIDWGQLLNIESELIKNESMATITIILIWFAISMPAAVPIKVLMGLQMGFTANLWLAVGSLAGLGSVLAVIHLEGGLPYLAVATIAPPVVVGGLAGLYLFFKQKPYLRPKFCRISGVEVKQLASTSSLFFVLQISGLIAFQSDNLIIAHYLGAESVAVYAVTFKLFTIPSIILSLFLNALWPAYAEAKSRGDKQWIYNSFRKSLKVSAAIAVPISLVTLFCGPWIIEHWVGKSISPTLDLLVGLFFWSLLTILGGNFSALMNGLGVIKFQMVASVAMAIVNVILSILLVRMFGVSGVIWGSVLSLAIMLYLPSALYIRKYFQ